MSRPAATARRLQDFKKMRRAGVAYLASVLVVTPAFVAKADTVSVVLSDRVGQTIDQTERAQFGLFPGTEDFVSADAVAEVDGTVILSIHRQASADSTLRLSPGEATLLGRYITSYELIMEGKAPGRCDVIGHLVGDGVRRRNGAPVSVQIDPCAVSGIIVCVTDSVLLLWTERQPVDTERLAEGASVIPARMIDYVGKGPLVQRGGSKAGTGALIGGLLGVTIGAAAAAGTHTKESGVAPVDDFGRALERGADSMALVICGLGGVVIGALIGEGASTEVTYAPSETIVIDRNPALFRARLPSLRYVAVFPWELPPAVRDFLAGGREVHRTALTDANQRPVSNPAWESPPVYPRRASL